MKDLALHILDIMQNCVAAEARLIRLTIRESPDENLYFLAIEDDGKGMDVNVLNKVSDPFFTTRTTRRVGLGIPLLKQNTERTGGTFAINSAPGAGTKIECAFIFDHIDRLPTGDLPGVIALTASSLPDTDIIYTHTTPEGSFVFSTAEIKETLGQVPISTPEVISFMKEMITENLKNINASS